jgi:hypothetical protein
MTDKLLILRAFSTLNQVRDAKVPELNLLPSFHELVEDLRARLAQPEPEPVACAACSGRGWYTCGASDMRLKCPECKGKKTAPPQRNWQGLTDEEMLDTYAPNRIPDSAYSNMGEDLKKIHDAAKEEMLSGLRAIEAKLKEKNN